MPESNVYFHIPQCTSDASSDWSARPGVESGLHKSVNPTLSAFGTPAWGDPVQILPRSLASEN